MKINNIFIINNFIFSCKKFSGYKWWQSLKLLIYLLQIINVYVFLLTIYISEIRNNEETLKMTGHDLQKI